MDLNELSGFISGCDNSGYLIDHYNHVANRLRSLGVPVALYEPMPLAEGPARSPALAEGPGPDLFARPVAKADSLIDEDIPSVLEKPTSEPYIFDEDKSFAYGRKPDLAESKPALPEVAKKNVADEDKGRYREVGESAKTEPHHPPTAGMPDYSKFPAELKQKLEVAWKERHSQKL